MWVYEFCINFILLTHFFNTTLRFFGSRLLQTINFETYWALMFEKPFWVFEGILWYKYTWSLRFFFFLSILNLISKILVSKWMGIFPIALNSHWKPGNKCVIRTFISVLYCKSYWYTYWHTLKQTNKVSASL